MKKVSKEILDQMKSIDREVEKCEKSVKNLIRLMLETQAETLVELKDERSKLWERIYKENGLDTDRIWGINRETGEISCKDVENEESEDCGDPNCDACRIKRSIKPLFGSSENLTKEEFMQRLGSVFQNSLRGIREVEDTDSEVRVRTPFGVSAIPNHNKKPTIH